MKIFTHQNVAANMNVVSWGDRTLFFSYATLVAANIAGEKMRTAERFSSTTSGHMTKMGCKDFPEIKGTHADFERAVERAISGEA